ncbi:hypothetical protein D6D01_10303 [Aureobasidium pullulans]|uniref:Uncharacterized protein n=1 Tax=Aureobasidium pullulans TaxID=5580 RepID=A0A4S9JKS9_AURPU|nr:hypothetical protein D6D01_10303 [Aureobasidium pullulans]
MAQERVAKDPKAAPCVRQAGRDVQLWYDVPTQMDDTASVASVVSIDESEPHFYKITSDEMKKLKHSLTLMEDRMSSLWILMGRAHIEPVLNELSTVNVTLAKAEKVSVDLTPDLSECGDYYTELDDPEPKPEPQHVRPGIDEFLIRTGMAAILGDMIDGLKDLKSADATAMMECIEELEYDMAQELHAVIREAAERTPEFLKRFEANARKLTIEFFTKKWQENALERITKIFKQI